MIFIGDVAIPDGIKPRIDYLPESFVKQTVIANLEGAIASSDQVSISENKLYSNDCVIDFLKECHVDAVSLANNHILDVYESFDRTSDVLQKANIRYFGAGNNLTRAQAPVEITEGNEQYLLISFGWSVISCIYATDRMAGVNPLEAKNIFPFIEKLIKSHPEKRIITIMHWDYELERFPMPAHRKLAKALIDMGVEAVIGHHPHCVQGVEVYKGKLIAYSVGNWFIPGKVYMNRKLAFPDYANDEIAMEITQDSFIVHRYRYDINNHTLMFVSSIDLVESEFISSLSEFRDMTDSEYEAWFRENRYKKKFLPVFHDYNSSLSNSLKYKWISIRQKGINALFNKGLKKRSGVDE